ncbi:Rne/Rng family ribonuclease [Microbacterium sp. STN6]|uniref:Rne/Rng family ribonuclease n=1 Tax=Microbacterium sp. STN6 TaxID=2995588 RepID=UPI002260F4C5|nr:Rne/Rng family ribonuclease [Microbacterium sp. STN6]MCX7522236.1 Rne/Rng family ribonuclease [Microbacterium sp. STN6]
MVEDDNTNNQAADNTTGETRKRGRLFGSRRASRKPEQAEVEVVAEATAPADPSAGRVGANGAVSRPAHEHVEPAAEPPQADAPAQTVTAESAAEPAPAPEVSAARTGLPSTSILFKAPDIVPLPPLPGNEREERDDRGDEPEEGTRTRKRQRRRSGDSGDESSSRSRQREAPEPITEPQRIKGSTRLEAKKQRRRDGRDAGRRRPVITEAEFLARREAVDRTMIVREKNGRIQIGVLEDSVLVEHYVARSQEASLIGNVYLGRVQNVLPSMEAAFVDIGRGRNAVLYSGEVDWEAAAENAGGNQARRIELALKPGDKVLVQVTKDPVGHKGARLTSQVSLPGRYLVYVPNGSMNGISRKLPDTERARLKKILKEVLPENTGVIVRTAAEGATDDQLTLDVNRLRAQWEAISAQAENGQAPAMLHSEPDLLIKIVRDVFNEDFHRLVIEGDEARETIERYLSQVAPDLLERVERYEGAKDSFDEFRITEQIEKALERKVWLPSGGSLVIDRTEAMTVVDVNTGKFVGSGGNLEETVTKNNLEAAEEIVRQLRLRDIGGIIVVDFIDMVLETNRDLVLRRLVECLSRDRTKHQVAEVTSLGLVQMTRKKLGLGLLETFSEPCEVCAGRGVVVHHDPVAKHRSSSNSSERRRGKGGNGGGNGGGSSNAPAVAPHAITDDAKNALAQIAASTLAAHAADLTTEHGQEITQARIDDVIAEEKTEENASGRTGKSSRGRKRDTGRQTAEQNAEQRTEQAMEQSTVAILDIPIEPAPRARQRAKSSETEHLLDSVLEALPQPKQPGHGRSRSRRVTTAALTGVAVTPESAGETHQA